MKKQQEGNSHLHMSNKISTISLTLLFSFGIFLLTTTGLRCLIWLWSISRTNYSIDGPNITSLFSSSLPRSSLWISSLVSTPFNYTRFHYWGHSLSLESEIRELLQIVRWSYPSDQRPRRIFRHYNLRRRRWERLRWWWGWDGPGSEIEENFRWIEQRSFI